MTEPGDPSLAAFFSQPADEDEPETTLAAFYAQPSEDDAEASYFPGGGEGVTPETLGPLQVAATADTPEVDGFLAGLETYELTDELARRMGGTVTGVVVRVFGESWERIIGINP